MHGIRAILVLVTVGVQYSAAACPDVDAALAEVKTCLEGKLTDITMFTSSSKGDAVCKNETTMNGHVSPCAAPVADCPDADKQTGMQHVADAELKVTEKCGYYEKQKLCDKEVEKCGTFFSTQLDFLGPLVNGDYNATQQEEQCTLRGGISGDEFITCLKAAREMDVCKMAAMGGFGPPIAPDGGDFYVYLYEGYLSLCDEECNDLKTKLGKWGLCINSTSYTDDLSEIEKAVMLNQTTGLENQCKSLTNHMMACFKEFECCATLTRSMQISVQQHVPILPCPKMQSALEEQCPKDTDKTTVSTISSMETSKASQMTTSMLVLSGTLVLWAF